jgi:uncharacterized protein YkwD
MRGPALVAVALIALASAPTAVSAAQATPVAQEARSFALLNESRAEFAVRPLVDQADLTAIARAQAARMAARGYIYHNPNLAADANAAGLRWARLGENVGVGPNVDMIHDAFLASPPHRDNMLYSAYNAIGVGVVRGTGNWSGEFFVSHVFGRLLAAPPHPVSTPTPNVLVGGLVDQTVAFGDVNPSFAS